jgi:predicted DNA-binding antitoxin AbrB/MazE fold protein
MQKRVQAIYEKGVFRPLEPVNLPENELVTVNIVNGTPASEEELLDTEFLASCAQEADPTITLESVRQALSTIPGSMTEDFIAERNER